MITMKDLWEQMMDDKSKRATAILGEPVTLRRWRGHGFTPEFKEIPLKAGAKVKVVMASRFGDVGITDRLSADNGYDLRIQCVEAFSDFGGQRKADEGVLTQIKFV